MEYNGLGWAWLENRGNNLFGSMACWFQFLGWATLTWCFTNVCGLVCIKVKRFGLGTFWIGPFIELGSDWDKAFGKLAWDSTWSGLKRTRSILQELNLTHPTNKSATYSDISLNLNLSFSLSLSLSLNLQELTFTVEIPEISPSSLMILDTSWRKVSKYL